MTLWAALMLLVAGCSKHAELPAVTINGVEKTGNRITVTASADDGGDALQDVGFFIKEGITDNPYNGGQKKNAVWDRSNSDFSLTIPDADNYLYSICAYATNMVGTAYSEVTLVGDYAITGGYEIASDKRSIQIRGKAYAPLGSSFERIGFIWSSSDLEGGWLREVSGYHGKTEASYMTSMVVSPGETFSYRAMFEAGGKTYQGETKTVYIPQ